jgi:hypothetical protein
MVGILLGVFCLRSETFKAHPNRPRAKVSGERLMQIRLGLLRNGDAEVSLHWSNQLYFSFRLQ